MELSSALKVWSGRGLSCGLWPSDWFGRLSEGSITRSFSPWSTHIGHSSLNNFNVMHLFITNNCSIDAFVFVRALETSWKQSWTKSRPFLQLSARPSSNSFWLPERCVVLFKIIFFAVALTALVERKISFVHTYTGKRVMWASIKPNLSHWFLSVCITGGGVYSGQECLSAASLFSRHRNQKIVSGRTAVTLG